MRNPNKNYPHCDDLKKDNPPKEVEDAYESVMERIIHGNDTVMKAMEGLPEGLMGKDRDTLDTYWWYRAAKCITRMRKELGQ